MTCRKCYATFGSLLQLAQHIEEVHQGGSSGTGSGDERILGSPSGEGKLVDCPYCISAYPRRDKLNVHIKKTHPGKPLVRSDTSPVKILPRPSATADFDSDSFADSPDTSSSST